MVKMSFFIEIFYCYNCTYFNFANAAEEGGGSERGGNLSSRSWKVIYSSFCSLNDSIGGLASTDGIWWHFLRYGSEIVQLCAIKMCNYVVPKTPKMCTYTMR